jgi:uncharacterized coiled-coil protein SlyX
MEPGEPIIEPKLPENPSGVDSATPESFRAGDLAKIQERVKELEARSARDKNSRERLLAKWGDSREERNELRAELKRLRARIAAAGPEEAVSEPPNEPPESDGAEAVQSKF